MADIREISIMQIPPPSPNRFVEYWNTWNSLAGDLISRMVTKQPKQNESETIAEHILFDALLDGKFGNVKITKAVNSRQIITAWVKAHVIFSKLLANLSSFGEGAIHISMTRTAETMDVTKRRTWIATKKNGAPLNFCLDLGEEYIKNITKSTDGTKHNTSQTSKD